MSAPQRLARLLTLVPWLLSHEGVTIDEAARHFNVSARDLEQDLWLLVVSGLPGHGPDQLVDIDFWDDGLIRVIDPQTLDRPMRLTQDEALILLMALRTLAQVPGLADRTAITSASAKLEAALDGTTHGSDLAQVDLGTTEHVRSAIDAALEHGRALAITYATASRDEVTERTVTPRQVRVVDGIGYLEGWCSLAGSDRTFRLDRILTADVVDLPDALPERDPGDEDGTTMDVREATIARLSLGPSARWIIDVHRSTTVVSEDSDGRVLVDLPLQSIDWGVRLVMSLGGAVTAQGPDELVTAVRQAAAAALAGYGGRVG